MPTNVTERSSHKIVSDITTFYVNLLLLGFATGLISIIGILTNIINIIVFIRQGVHSENSASLLGLAVTDLLNVFTMLWVSVGHAVVLADPPGLSWIPYDILYLFAGCPHLICTQTTRVVTTYVALERCVCVVFPFKVKTLFTSKRTFMVIAGTFVISALMFSPLYIENNLGFKLDPATNRTRLGMISSQQLKVTVDILIFVNYIIFNQGPVTAVLICTVITVFHVNLSKTWRESLAPGGTSADPKSTSTKTDSSLSTNHQSGKTKPKSLSNAKMKKEKKLVVMITSISIIFMVCYIPNFIYLIIKLLNPDVNLLGAQHNLSVVFFAISFLSDTINSSINIVIYYQMSSRFKQELRRFFHFKDS